MLGLKPITYREACEYITLHHRHHKPPQGWKFGIACTLEDKVVGVITVGRPVARSLDDGFTAEVTRCCTTGERNVNSKLYGAASRACKAMGYKKIITYTLTSESGVSLKASGFIAQHTVRGRSWACPSRPRQDKHPLVDKQYWEKDLTK